MAVGDIHIVDPDRAAQWVPPRLTKQVQVQDGRSQVAGAARTGVSIPQRPAPYKTPGQYGGGFLGRVGGVFQSLANVFLGRDAWLGPQLPLEPMQPPGEPPRKFQYQPGYNVQIQPRSTEAVGFSTLRGLADTCDALRIVLERAKSAILADEWDIVGRDGAKVSETKKKTLKRFWEKPDKSHLWDEWLAMLLEDMFVLDAVSIYIDRNRGQGVYGFRLIDGATIKPLIDIYGREPDPPIPAYQQFLFGTPYAVFTKDELCYRPKCRRTGYIYGYPPVEQIIFTINMAIRRWLYNLQQFAEGNIPAAVGSVPKEWGLNDALAWQEAWDAYLAGDPLNRSRIRWVPGDVKITEFRNAEVFGLKNDFDEWMMRIICYVIGVSPIGFTKQTNRSTAESAERQEQEQGLEGHRIYIKRLINKLMYDHLGEEEAQFDWITDHAHNATLKITRNVQYVQQGILLRDEVRDEEGYPPLADAAKEYGVEVPPLATGPTGGFAPTASGPTNPSKPGFPQAHPAEPQHMADAQHEDLAADQHIIHDEMTMHQKLAESDLRKWRVKAEKAYLNTGSADVKFASDSIPAEVQHKLRAELQKGFGSLADLRRAFDAIKDEGIYIQPPRKNQGSDHRTKLKTLLAQAGLRVLESVKP